jgi:hypothetical protein
MQNIKTIGSEKKKISPEFLSSGAEFRGIGFNKKELYSQIEIEANPERCGDY